jgi:ribosomal protein S18 acetylase RimI-like enzyme
VNVIDWRRADSVLMRALYSEEHQRWLAQLGWNTSDTWAEVEAARVGGRLPGFLARPDDGDPADVRGWAYALMDAGVMQVGGFTARSIDATRVLLDALASQAKAERAEGLSAFVYSDAPGFEEELAARQFQVDRYRYLVRPPSVSNPTEIAPGEAWAPDDIARAACLLQASYGPSGKAFAAHGRIDEWERYVRNLVEYPACGHFDAAATRVLRDGDRLLGLVMVTALGPGMAHIAQVAVHPASRGQGLAGRLLDDAIAYVTSQGLPRVSLLVRDTVADANALYQHRGFEPTTTFISARKNLDMRR